MRALDLFATAPKGLSALLAGELEDLGAHKVKQHPAGVSFRGSMACAYRACLWSRTASRVLLNIARYRAPTPDALYEGAHSVLWREHLDASRTLSVGFSSRKSSITHSRYGAQRIKDAVVDQLRTGTGERPSVAIKRPDVRINAHLERDEAVLSIDLAGESLHRRGYRVEATAAPLKENLAAGMLLLCRWPQIARQGAGLVDAMCGSGTLALEGAMIAADIAPGLGRRYYGFLGWLGHEQELWEELLAEAAARRAAGLARLPEITGFDADDRALAIARANAARAGLAAKVRFERVAVESLSPSAAATRPGLVVANPPYGQRLGEPGELERLYATFADRLSVAFDGWEAGVLLGAERAPAALRPLRARRRYTLYNGAIECRLLTFSISKRRPHAAAKPLPLASAPSSALTSQAQMFANRLRKNLRTLGRWAKRNDITCYRLYDADMPEFALAIDLYYQGQQLWVHAQEYEAPATISQAAAETRLRMALEVLQDALDVGPERLLLKQRRRQRRQAQYQRLSHRDRFIEVEEASCRVLVNLSDYVDTGLFLDTRPVRGLIRDLAAGVGVLNLFAYTGVATLQAIAGGATSSTSVDASNTYVEWGRKNLALNDVDSERHRYVRADCLSWLEQTAPAAGKKQGFGLIYLDPPTFSNSKRSQRAFDLQRDHLELIGLAARHLAPRGVLIFCNHNRRFRMHADQLEALHVENITPRTIPKDFQRNPRIHNCWKIQRQGTGKPLASV